VRLPVVILDGLGDLVEVPLLLSHVVSPSLQPNVVGTMALSNSLERHSRSEVEWSVNVESEFRVETLLSILFSLVEINNLPLLTFAFVICPNTNSLSFLVLGIFHIKHLTALPVDELVVLILEHLEPSGVGAPDLHVVGSSSILDVPGLVVVSGSNGQRLLVEVPDLGSSAILGLDDHVSVVDQVKVSVVWKC